MSLEPKSAVEEDNTVPSRKPRFTMTVLHLPRNVYLLQKSEHESPRDSSGG